MQGTGATAADASQRQGASHGPTVAEPSAYLLRRIDDTIISGSFQREQRRCVALSASTEVTPDQGRHHVNGLTGLRRLTPFVRRRGCDVMLVSERHETWLRQEDEMRKLQGHETDLEPGNNEELERNSPDTTKKKNQHQVDRRELLKAAKREQVDH
ncbi:hypothetical protein F2P81_017596 [Scophthalmus maximus]|uniref:Uncharacterized protein n=1 Tax=Scophthalmus maximus TaxID=52904 RepID=A0A6A4SEA9_SCOMX|nr:hypothetical protein F2P81_017596 [Scophthalmus maximus]